MKLSRTLSVPLAAATAAVLTLAGCGGDRPAEPASEPAVETADEATVYRVRGVVRKIVDGGAMAVIDHEEIPGYMAAMSMPFHPREPALFASLEPGQRIEFDYHVADTSSWVENITVLADQPDEAPAAEPPVSPSPEGSGE